jgi:hypothetical protein
MRFKGDVRVARQSIPMVVAMAAVLAFAAQPGCAADTQAAPAATDASSDANGVSRYFKEWFERSDRAKESQPHWMTPVVTVTPRLEQEYRYDQLWQTRPKGISVQNYGLNKGLELIPTEHSEIILGVPGYIKETGPTEDKQGFADASLLLKYRFLSANEENGNYIVTGFLGVAVPTGSDEFTTGHTIYTPTIAAGKGWGTRERGVDIQTTLGISLPDGNQSRIGVPIVWNTAFQAHVADKLWPEVEANYTYWKEGPNAGKGQMVITSGLILGRYELIDRVRFVLGAGYQQAVSSFRTFNHGWIVTARAPF